MARVLVIDDDDRVRTWMRTVLEGAGHEVVEAADGEEGIRAARRQAVDLTFCDIFMPVREGLETIRDLRRDFPALPIVAMSGGGYGGQIDMLPVAELLGVTRTLEKPFGTQAVLDAVREALAGPPRGGQ